MPASAESTPHSGWMGSARQTFPYLSLHGRVMPDANRLGRDDGRRWPATLHVLLARGHGFQMGDPDSDADEF